MSLNAEKLLGAALECSVFLCPTDPGLSPDELKTIGASVGLLPGEINDSMFEAGQWKNGYDRLLPSQNKIVFWRFYTPEEPELKDFKALDFIYQTLYDLCRSMGVAHAKIERTTLVERAVAKGIARIGIEAAVTTMLIGELLTEQNGLLQFPWRQAPASLPTLPSEQLRNRKGSTVHDSIRAQVLPFVQDMIERRSDGRPKYAEPLAQFADTLNALGYSQFRTWWLQIVAELARSDSAIASISVTVLSGLLPDR